MFSIEIERRGGVTITRCTQPGFPLVLATADTNSRTSGGKPEHRVEPTSVYRAGLRFAPDRGRKEQ